MNERLMSVPSGRHAHWDGVFGVICADGREWGRTVIVDDWYLLEGEGRAVHRLHYGSSSYVNAKALPPPRAEDRYFHDTLGWYVHLFPGALGWVPEPPASVQGFADGTDLRGVPSAPQGGSGDVSRVSLPPPQARNWDYVSRVSLPPPQARNWDYEADAVRVDGRWLPAPSVPETYRRRTKVQEVSHRVWQDFGTDGVRRWQRWWCSCGAGGLGWPTSHPEED